RRGVLIWLGGWQVKRKSVTPGSRIDPLRIPTSYLFIPIDAEARLRGLAEYVLLHPGYAALVAPAGCLPKARNAAIRASVGGCVENNLRKLVPENGFMMYMWDIEGEASSGICIPTVSSFSSALIIGCAVPSVRADVASALNSRVLEIAIRINPAAIGARQIISRPAIGLRPRRSASLRPAPTHMASGAR